MGERLDTSRHRLLAIVAVVMAAAVVQRLYAAGQTADDYCGAHPRAHASLLLGQALLVFTAWFGLSAGLAAESRRARVAGAALALVALVGAGLIFTTRGLMAFDLGDC